MNTPAYNHSALPSVRPKGEVGSSDHDRVNTTDIKIFRQFAQRPARRRFHKMWPAPWHEHSFVAVTHQERYIFFPPYRKRLTDGVGISHRRHQQQANTHRAYGTNPPFAARGIHQHGN